MGRSIWDFISDKSTRQFYRDMLARVRQGHVLRFPFRCDSPSYKRQLQMTMSPAPRQTIDLTVDSISVEPRASQALMEPWRRHTDQMLRMCGWCKRVHLKGRWLEVDAAANELGLFQDSPVPSLSHGMCEDCYAKIERLIDGK